MKDLARAAAALVAGWSVSLACAQSVIWDTTLVSRILMGSAPNDVVADASGNFVVVGPDCHATKYSGADGSTLWNVDVPGQDQVSYCRIRLDASGNLLLAGQHGVGVDSSARFDAYKLSGATGAVAWHVTTPVPALVLSSNTFTSFALDASGNPLLVSAAGDASYTSHLRMTSLSGVDGTVRWDILDSAVLGGARVATDAGGNAVIAADAYYSGSQVLKISTADGSVLWRQAFAGGVRDVALDASGNAIVAGCNACTSSLRADFAILKYSAADGTLLWQKAYDGPLGKAEVPLRISIDTHGDVMVAGQSADASVTSDSYGSLSYLDLYEVEAIKMSGADGTLLWSRRFTPPSGKMLHLIQAAADPAGNFVLSATPWTWGLANGQFRTIKLDSASGASLWDTTLTRASDGNDQPYAIAFDAAGNIALAGSSFDGAVPDYKIFKLGTATGMPLWEAGPLNRLYPRFTAGGQLGLDRTGNVFVAGWYRGPTSIPDDNEEFMAARLSPADGSTQWLTQIPSPLPDGPSAMAIDGQGNPVFGGFTTGASTNADWAALKLAGASGQVQWVQTYNDTKNDDDYAFAVATDAAGNAFVTGRVNENGSLAKTVKYDGMTGAILWQRTSAEIGSGDSIAILPSGDPLVTANLYVYDASTASYVYTASTTRLDSATGAVVWRADVSGMDYARSMVDAVGNVVLQGTTSSGWRVIKYDGPTGTVLWDRVIGNAPNQFLAHMALDGAGNVFLTGSFYLGGSPATVEARTYKVRSVDGSTAWMQTRNGGTGTSVYATAIAADAAGNAYVGGARPDATSGHAMYVMKYRAADGTPDWEYAATDSVSTSDIGPVDIVASSGSLYVSVGYGALRIFKLDVRMPTSLALSSAPEPSPNRSAAMITATVSATSGTPTGTVRFLSDGSVVNGCAAIAIAAGTAQCSTGTLVPGTHALTAVYSGDASFQPSAGSGSHTVDSTAAASTVAQHLDFSGDGHSDLAWQAADGTLSVWVMNGNTVMARAPVLGAAPGSITKAADFDGDGKVDLLRQLADGTTTLYRMNGVDIASSTVIRNAGSGWHLNNLGDFNADGKADILWRHDDGSVQIWLMDGATTLSSATVMAPGTGWTPLKVADFNGDGKSDLLWAYVDGTTSIWLMNGTAKSSGGAIMAAGTGWRATHVGDFNGDGKSDLLWRHDGDGAVSMWLMDGLAQLDRGPLMPANSGWSVSQVAKLNSDATSDILWQHTDGTTSAWLMNGRAAVAKGQVMPPGTGWGVAQVVDTRGVGKGDLVWQNTNGAVGLWIMDWGAPVNGAFTATARYSVFGAGSAWRPAVGLEANR